MFRPKLIRNLRTVIWIVLVALIPAAITGIYWANKTGLPEEWREAIETEISNHGAHIELGSLRYVPLKGFVAKDVRMFAEKERIHEISKLERVQLVLDYASLAGGEFRVRKVDLVNAELILPVDPKNPTGESLTFTGVNGTILMPNDKTMEIRNTTGRVGGIEIDLSARLLSKSSGKRGKYDEKRDGRRREMIARVLRQLENWNFDPENPPRVKIEIDGRLADKESLNATFQIHAPSVEKNQYRLTDLTASGSLSRNLLNISSFTAEDTRGKISGSIDYQLDNQNGRFDVESSIDIPRFLRSWLEFPLKLDLLSGGNQRLAFAGDFDLNETDKPSVNLIGQARCESIMFRGISFDSMETWFSWQDGNLFLRDLKLRRPDGQAKGKILQQGEVIRIELDSTLPIRLYEPFFRGKPLEKVIANFSENKNAFCNLALEGTLNTQDKYAWAFQGKGDLKHMSYRGVPVKSANCSFNVDQEKFDFRDGEVVFDYSDYTLKKTYDGPKTGSASIGRIRYDREPKTITVEAVKGDIWAAPLVRLFSPKIADSLEKYRFHQPPALLGSGIIDLKKQGQTNLKVEFTSTSAADYDFLGKSITLSEPQATVRVKAKEVRITGLKAGAFGGPITGKFVSESDTSGFSGEITWSKIGMTPLASTYGFEVEGDGQLTGRIEFKLTDLDVATMQGKGLVALEDGELFSVPIFGPLSTIISKVVNNKRTGFERAKTAFCNFTIDDGILKTRDFQTQTTSVKFTGDGSIDLSERTIDFTIRLNARGLLGLITLPLRPFYGLFQFRGTGPLKDPEWENVRFTKPPKDQNELLLAPPPKATAVPEP
jgi:hypothetical protein